jgi:predicted dehydrogenase
MSVLASRRSVIRSSVFAGLSVWIAGRSNAATAEKLNVAVIGVANRGGANLNGVATENVVAICDVDGRYLNKAAEKFPQAAKFSDFRKLLDEVKNLDAVVVSTPDHTHAAATLRALRTGKHVYCEKPLTHNVAEARLVMSEAAKAKRATQMGTQIHASDNYRRVVELIQAGAIGAVRRVHVFATSKYGLNRQTDAGPTPAPEFNWDLWLGPAVERPYRPGYHPQAWRLHWDFGGGTLGDFGCHHIDLSFWALGLGHPESVEAEGPVADAEAPPSDLKVHYRFPARGDRPAVHLTWYQAEKRPAVFDELGAPRAGNGTLFVGDKGMLLADYSKRVLLPKERFADYVPPKETIPASIGHHQEWIRACTDGTPTLCNFDYAGVLTQAVLLGNVAHRVEKKLEWNGERGVVSNAPEAGKFLTRAYRKGWEL